MNLPSFTFSHVKWFQEPVEKLSSSVNLSEIFLIFLFVVIGLALAYLLEKKYLKSFEELISRLAVPYAKYVPLIVRLSAGAGILAATIGGYFLAPNLDEVPSWLLISQGLIALFFIAGAGVRTSALILLFLLFAGMFIFSPAEIAEHLEYIGVAGYLMIMGPGVWSLKRLYLRENLPEPAKRHRALRIFMVAAGISLVWLALSEKILNIDLAQSFLTTHNWNFLSAFGASNRFFILFIGASEMLLGMLLVLNIIPRITTALITLAMITTAILLGPMEVPGHLYAVGLVAAVWANDGKYSLKRNRHNTNIKKQA